MAGFRATRLPRRRGFVWHAVGAGTALSGFSGCGTHEQSPAPSADAVVQEAPSFNLLLGRWRRPDGGYILEIRSVDDGGKVDAAYFNPRPINVARAQARREGGDINVEVELRDANYPGSTYRLRYDPADHCLKGTYYQAVAKETYPIFFVRVKS